MTPMQQQYKEIKQQYPQDIVLFRLGDFYEAFNDDAEAVSQVLGITLTGRGKGEERVPMAGIPYHSLDNYLPKLVQSGYKVVMVDQVTEAKPGQLVEREVSKIYTAGTLTEEKTLEDAHNNYIFSVYERSDKKQVTFGAAFADVSTGKLQVFETTDPKQLKAELQRLRPTEIIISTSQQHLQDLLSSKSTLTYRVDTEFAWEQAYDKALSQFQTSNLKGFGIEEQIVAIAALGALLNYIEETQRTDLRHITAVSQYNFQDYMQLDEQTIRNLELIEPLSGSDYKATVFSVLNQCMTNMGKRKLADWLLHPLLDQEKLQARWDSVDKFFSSSMFASQIRNELKQVGDIERIVGRIGVNAANAKDLISLKESLQNLQEVSELLQQEELPIRLQHIQEQIQTLGAITEVIQLLENALNPDPPASLLEGNILASGYNTEVDELRDLRSGGKQKLAEIQQRESERTEIPSLKVSYNKVFGYYIEVTKTHTDKVPEDYIRKQTLTNAERYITQELKDWEDKVMSAEERLVQLEYDLFVEVRSQVAEYAQQLLLLADYAAELDVLANFGHLALQYRYSKPQLGVSDENTQEVQISEGRHPVVERLQEEFTPNDTQFPQSVDMVLLTGPNMSGKSTYIRQTALLVLFAQIGSFVPAASMQLDLVDRIFTRVGAADNLSRGESTFMVEMNETANILHNASERSLVILDEVGRGTSTYDGVAIAWAIAEHLLTKVKANTLFATHYHELIDLQNTYKNVENYHVEVKEAEGKVHFLHKISPGATNKSYGVHVADMAGVPKSVVNRAWEILQSFEGDETESTPSKQPRTGDKTEAKEPSSPQKKQVPGQLGLIN